MRFVSARFAQVGSIFLRATLGRVLAVAYGLAQVARAQMYSRNLWWPAPSPPGCRVISIGGLEAGGSGKTPACQIVLARLLEQGHRPGLATRGYRRRERGLRLRQVGAPPSVDALGDEATMLILEGLDVPVAAARRRVEAVRALALLGCDVVVMDDGFAHRAQHRDIDLVVLRGEAPFGIGTLLPHGSLREPPHALRRASAVWLHYRESAAACALLAPELVTFAKAGRLITSHMSSRGAFDETGAEVALLGRQVAAFAGTARPDELRRMLCDAGADVVCFRALTDHAEVSQAWLDRFCATAYASMAQALVVTAKDAVKLSALSLRLPLLVWRVETRIDSGEQVLAELLKEALSDNS